jgi:hypothetical protein
MLAAVPGLVHGFEQRAPGSPAETRAQSRSRLSAALARDGRVLFLKQVHGVALAEAPWTAPPEADAAVCAASGFLLAIETADCLPILLVDPQRRTVAAAHAGWRGTAASIAGRTVAALVARGSQPDGLLAALGPAIGVCCYEVGPELRAVFGAEAEAVFREGERGRPRLDLRTANERQLLRAGVPGRAIAHVDECTRCRAADYHSYRRDGPGAGRMISYVGFAREYDTTSAPLKGEALGE